jgi:hypothetical protein
MIKLGKLIIKTRNHSERHKLEKFAESPPKVESKNVIEEGEEERIGRRRRRRRKEKGEEEEKINSLKI